MCQRLSHLMWNSSTTINLSELVVSGAGTVHHIISRYSLSHSITSSATEARLASSV